MLTHPQPTSLFQQTVYETEQEFYATFPAVRAAACNADFEQNLYNLSGSTDCSTSYDGVQPLDYYPHNEQMSNISSSSSSPFSSITPQLSHMPAHFDCSQVQQHQQTSPSYHPSYSPVSYFFFYPCLYILNGRFTRS